MKLRSSRIVGIPNYSHNIANIPCYSYRSTPNVLFMNIICVSGLCIVTFFCSMYIIFHFCTHLQNEMITPSVTLNWSDVFTNAI